MKHLVIGGLGEVGSALVQMLGADWIDLGGGKHDSGPYDFLHVAIPWGTTFTARVAEYAALFRCARVVVHSTVPVGTCGAHGWTHSPVRGVHPRMLAGLRTFVKYFGGAGATEAAAAWPGPSRVLSDARTCEALKLWDTTQYGVQIRLMQEIHRWCEQYGVSFDEVYSEANRTYNDGYAALGRPDVVRPALVYRGDRIGGHCVLPNAELLGGSVAELVRDGFKK